MQRRTAVRAAVAAVTFALAAPAAFAGIGFKAGEWDVDFSGNVNGFYTNSDCQTPAATTSVTGGLACTGDKSASVRNGLLPGALIFSAKTRQEDFDISATVGLYPGINSSAANGVNGPGLPSALRTPGIDARQTFFTFGDKSWGTVKIGRDIGIFGANAILSDMTLLGVGSTGGNAAPSNTSLGRIGIGYIYTDFMPQITFTSTDYRGLQFTGGIFSGLTPTDQRFSVHKSPQLQAQVSYGWKGDISGKAWLGGIGQKVEEAAPGSANYWGSGVDAGVKFTPAMLENFEGVLYGYYGDGIGTTGLFVLSNSTSGDKRKSSGGYVQGTYKLGRVKLGASYGESRLKLAADEVSTGNNLLDKNESGVGGVYYGLTKSVTLVGEYAYTRSTAQNGNEATEKTFILGGIIFF
jgi:predicted porin